MDDNNSKTPESPSENELDKNSKSETTIKPTEETTAGSLVERLGLDTFDLNDIGILLHTITPQEIIEKFREEFRAKHSMPQESKREVFFSMNAKERHHRASLKTIEIHISNELKCISLILQETYKALSELFFEYDIALRDVAVDLPGTPLLNKDLKKFQNIAKQNKKLYEKVNSYQEFIDNTEPNIKSELFKNIYQKYEQHDEKDKNHEKEDKEDGD